MSVAAKTTTQSGDLVDADFLNGLPHPLYVRGYGNDPWRPLHDIDVETGMHRIDVMGKLDVRGLGDINELRDSDGNTYQCGDLYADPECWETRAASRGARHDQLS